MKADIIKIGNSQGIRIPKTLLEQCNLNGQVDLQVDGDALVIKSARKVREGWEESFKAMAENGDDELLLPDDISPLPEEIDWEW